MVRRDEAGKLTASRCSSLAGASPASVGAGAPSSRPQVPRENAAARAGCQKPLRRKPARGPQPHVKPAASSDLQPESRAGHVAAKATSAMPQSGGVRIAGLGGVWGVARVHRDERNARGPSARPWSGQSGSYKPPAKSSRAQRESEGVVVPRIIVRQNAMGGKDPCFGRARNEGKRKGMAGKTGPNLPDSHKWVVNARQPQHELRMPANRQHGSLSRLRGDSRSDVRDIVRCGEHAASGRPSVSRVREIRMHGLKGGPALSPMTFVNV